MAKFRKIDDKDLVINELADLRYSKGFTNRSMLNYLKEEYGLKESRSYDLIREMYEMMAEIHEKVYSDPLKDSLDSLYKMKQDAIKEEDRRLALEIQKEINKLHALYKERIELETKSPIEIKYVNPK